MSAQKRFAGLLRRVSESARYYRRVVLTALGSLTTPRQLGTLAKLVRRSSERANCLRRSAVTALRSMRTSRQRGALAGALALTVAASTVVPLTFGRASVSAGTHRPPLAHKSSLLPLGPTGMPVRPLRHDESATAGIVRFRLPPPKVHKGRVEASLVSTTEGVPAVALAAYEHAAAVLDGRDAGCRLTWEDLAGIGHVESGNGLYWGSQARVTANGTLVPPIYGPSLDGRDGMPAMPTTDAGRLEHDGRWTRAVGPMQFLPATWAEYAQDGNGDGQRNPQNFYDAALTTAVFLCANGGGLASASGLRAAILAYNHSTSYLNLVEEWITFYTRAGTSVLLSADAGLLPLAQTTSSSKPGKTKPRPKAPTPHKPAAAHKPPAAHKHSPPPPPPPPPASPATLLEAAAASTVAKGSYSFTVTGLDGTSTVATGTGGVDTTHSAAWLAISLPAVGVVRMRDVAGVTYLSLPPTLSTAVGAEGPWVILTATVSARLPEPLSTSLSLASNDLVWLAAQFEGGAKSMRTVGSTSSKGTTEYAGDLFLPNAIQHVSASRLDLGRVARLLGSPNMTVDAWVSPAGLLQSALINLGSGFSSAAKFMAKVSFTAYGKPIQVLVPPVSPVSPTTTTTTTTTTAASSTPSRMAS